jgi:protein gp37
LDYAPKLGDPGMEGAAKYDTEEEGMNTMLELEKPYCGHDGVINPYPMAFYPTFHRYRLGIPTAWKKPRTIFVCSMADLFGEWVPEEWIKEVFDACLAAPQHRYIFLTKNGKRYTEFARKGLLPDGENFWYGCSTPIVKSMYWWSSGHHTFISIEPILEPFVIERYGDIEQCPQWIIVGAETGNRKEKVKPEKDWIYGIIEAGEEYGVPVFMKESLREIMGDDFIQEFPWD